MTPILTHAIHRRRTGLIGWALGLVGAVALVAFSYPAVRGNAELDQTFSQLSPAIRSLLGLSAGTGLTSPTGYLDSQFFANLFPVLLLVFGIGAGAWAIAGDEEAGTLELLLANPVSRLQVALARFAALAVMIGLLAAITLAALLVARDPAGFTEIPAANLGAAVAAVGALGLSYAAVAFALGALGTGRTVAAAGAGGVTVLGFALEGLGQAVAPLRPVRDLMPWHWLLGADPLSQGLSWQSLGWSLGLAAAVAAVGTARFVRRDLR